MLRKRRPCGPANHHTASPTIAAPTHRAAVGDALHPAFAPEPSGPSCRLYSRLRLRLSCNSPCGSISWRSSAFPGAAAEKLLCPGPLPGPDGRPSRIPSLLFLALHARFTLLHSRLTPPFVAMTSGAIAYPRACCLYMLSTSLHLTVHNQVRPVPRPHQGLLPPSVCLRPAPGPPRPTRPDIALPASSFFSPSRRWLVICLQSRPPSTSGSRPLCRHSRPRVVPRQCQSRSRPS